MGEARLAWRRAPLGRRAATRQAMYSRRPRPWQRPFALLVGTPQWAPSVSKNRTLGRRNAKGRRAHRGRLGRPA
jgi:hypothetical protein